MLLSALLPFKWMLAILLIVLLVIVAVPTLYSNCIYKAHKAQGIVYTAPAKRKVKEDCCKTFILQPSLYHMGL